MTPFFRRIMFPLGIVALTLTLPLPAHGDSRGWATLGFPLWVNPPAPRAPTPGYNPLEDLTGIKSALNLMLDLLENLNLRAGYYERITGEFFGGFVLDALWSQDIYLGRDPSSVGISFVQLGPSLMVFIPETPVFFTGDIGAVRVESKSQTSYGYGWGPGAELGVGLEFGPDRKGFILHLAYQRRRAMDTNHQGATFRLGAVF